jgi:hypothetical protein
MATLVSTGQITIVDNNDAKPISLLITANSSQQQIYTKNDTSVTYVPDYYTANLVLTPKIYVGGVGSATDVSTNAVTITNRKWGKTPGGGELYSGTTTYQDSTNFVQSNGTTAVPSPFTFSSNGLTLTITGNLKNTTVSYPVYFEADYTDTATGLVSHIVTVTELSLVTTGTNAVFVQFKGKLSIESSTSGTKNNIPVTADLIRSNGVDRGNLSYKWYNVTTGSAIQISTSSTAGYYAIGDTATGSIPATTTINNNRPASGSGSTYNSSGVGTGNTLTISELAIDDIGVFRVDITDSDESKTYSGYFTVFDYSDPYVVTVVSSSGDKLQNGIGSTSLTPVVYYGDTLVSTLASWVFTWVFYDRNGKRAGFVDPSSTNAATNYYNGGAGIPITSNSTTGIYHNNIANALVIGTNNIIKVVKDGIATFYEVDSAAIGGINIKTSGLTYLSLTDYPVPTTNSLVGGVIYACTLNGTRSTTDNTPIVVTGYDIDVKGRITCGANRP